MPPFRHALRVRWHECDPQEVVFNAHYLAYFDLAITELWREALGGHQAMVARGLDLVVAEARIRYRAPLRFDDEFEIVVAVADMGNTSLKSELRIERDGDLAVEGELRHVFVDAESGEKAPIPDDIREALSPYAG